MDYDKLISLMNKENLSNRAMAKIVNMTVGGFIPMLKNKTMKVETLEKLANHFQKPISYFFEDTEDLSDQLQDPNGVYFTCVKCSEKDGMIKILERQSKQKEELIRELYKENGSLKKELEEKGNSNDPEQAQAVS